MDGEDEGPINERKIALSSVRANSTRARRAAAPEQARVHVELKRMAITPVRDEVDHGRADRIKKYMEDALRLTSKSTASDDQPGQ